MLGSPEQPIVFCKRHRAAFTLVEMLTVMGIIVILLAATIPALRGLSQTESRKGAVGSLLGVLDRARMMAISDGLATYVVFACKTNTGTQVNPDLWGRAYAIYQDGDNLSFNPVQKTPWMQLPKGMAFKVDDGGGTYATVTNQALSSEPPHPDPQFAVGKAVAAGGSSQASVLLPYWKFDGTGALVDPPTSQGTDSNLDHYRRLLLFPGLVNASGSEVSTQNISGGSNAKTLQLAEIDLTRSTGRARYIVNPSNNLQSTPSSTPPTP